MDGGLVVEMLDGTMKLCTNKDCSIKQEQPRAAFYNHKKTSDGLSPWCKECTKADNKRCYNRDKERRILQNNTWRHNNTYRKHKGTQCESCNFIALDPCQLDIDHVDGNHSNDDVSNLITLCANCHRLKSKLNKDTRSIKLKLVV